MQLIFEFHAMNRRYIAMPSRQRERMRELRGELIPEHWEEWGLVLYENKLVALRWFGFLGSPEEVHRWIVCRAGELSWGPAGQLFLDRRDGSGADELPKPNFWCSVKGPWIPFDAGGGLAIRSTEGRVK